MRRGCTEDFSQSPLFLSQVTGGGGAAAYVATEDLDIANPNCGSNLLSGDDSFIDVRELVHFYEDFCKISDREKESR